MLFADDELGGNFFDLQDFGPELPCESCGKDISWRVTPATAQRPDKDRFKPRFCLPCLGERRKVQGRAKSKRYYHRHKSDPEWHARFRARRRARYHERKRERELRGS